MKKPESEHEQAIAKEAYRQAYTEAAEMIEDIRGKDVGRHGDTFAGMWAACRMAANSHEPWGD